MRVRILAVGRAQRGPEADLVADYLSRFDRTGRPLGLGPATLSELDERKGGSPARDAKLFRVALRDAPSLIALDERGRTLSSPAFAAHLADLRDQGAREAAFLIGGADGLPPDLRGEAQLTLSFGPMVWPHLLARVMLAEQLYRAATILAGGPYHRA
ncbi:MAG: 23S rRNA (pseudouridine(1915)-N(3))-methyltransferase RlmH [Pseudomonadota bacterium]|mgnify:CR=1 FL=1